MPKTGQGYGANSFLLLSFFLLLASKAKALLSKLMIPKVEESETPAPARPKSLSLMTAIDPSGSTAKPSGLSLGK